MSTLSEIEAAVDALPAEQKQHLLLFLTARMRATGARMPEPRDYSLQQIEQWIEEDEKDLEKFRSGK